MQLNNRNILSALFILTGCLALINCYLQLLEEPEIKHQVEVKLNKPTHVLLQSNTLLSIDTIEFIRLHNQKIIIGRDTLSFKKDKIQSIVYDLPEKQERWKEYLMIKLAATKELNFEIVLSKLMGQFETEWINLSKQKSWNSLSDVQKCCHLLVNSIETNQDEVFFIAKNGLNRLPKANIKVINDKHLDLTSQKIDSAQNEIDGISWGLTSGLILVSIIGIFFANRKITESIKHQQNHVQSIEIEEPPLIEKECIKEIEEKNDSQYDSLVKYFQNFHSRYGDFYTNIEQLPEFPTDELTKQKIKSQLVEMGLHAHSFSRALLFDYFRRPEKEPNILLIQMRQSVTDLDQNLYKTLTFDAYETSKRYRFLAKILIEMNIGSLDGALLHDTFLSKESLTQP